MALPMLAPLSALETRLGLVAGSLVDADKARALACLEDASTLARDAANATWVDAAGDLVEDVPAVVVTVVLQAAKRAYSNPDGLASESIGSGAYAYSLGTAAQAGLYLTADEVAIVKRAAAGKASGAYSVGTPSAYGERPLLPDFGGDAWL